MEKEYLCLLCDKLVEESKIERHKKRLHQAQKHYGVMWPLFSEEILARDLYNIPTYESAILAQELGVSKVYIRDEGQNFSGSMKDYSVEKAVRIGLQQGFKNFSVVSSGNHAVSLAKYSKRYGVKALVFAPASSSKIGLLASLQNTFVVGVKDAIFEDVYTLAAGMSFDGIYNANVSNELLLSGFYPVAEQITILNPPPSHILAGVGNGSYLAGIALGLERLAITMPKIVPVGMQGAFPTETAFTEGKLLREYDEFLTDESVIDAAEGSIAIASYSIPQLMHALYLSKGFPLGGLTNEDLKTAFLILARDVNLLEKGAIPEPTGIMGLAAALKYKEMFTKSDTPLIAFTGHGVKDIKGIGRLVPEISDKLIYRAKNSRPDLSVNDQGYAEKVLFVYKGISPQELEVLIRRKLGD